MDAHWKRVLEENLRKDFISPYKDENQNLKDLVNEALDGINNLKKSKGKKPYLGDINKSFKYEEEFHTIKEVEKFPQHMSNAKELIEEALEYYEGGVNWNHPKTMINILPPTTNTSLVGSLIGSILNTNIVEHESAGNLANLEVKTASMISDLVGYDSRNSWGHFTFGGTGAYLYSGKLAITKLFGIKSRYEGIKEDCKIFVSKSGHYAKDTISDWLGIGMNNVVEIDVLDDSSMDLSDFEIKLESAYKNNEKVAMVVATMGTTDAFGIDDIEGINNIIKELNLKYKIEHKPFIYADAVIGWAFCAFNDYDIDENNLDFSNIVLKRIKNIKYRMKNICLADAIGIDFHKTGFTPYNCSMVLLKDEDDINYLKRDKKKTSYLYNFGEYKPGQHTLECSRGSNYPLMAYLGLKYLGKIGFQTVLGHLLEVSNSIREEIKETNDIVCVNDESNGGVTLFRVYKDEDLLNISARDYYDNENSNEVYKNKLVENNKYQYEIASELKELIKTDDAPFFSFTTKFKYSKYGVEIAALKSYPMSLYIDNDREYINNEVIKYIKMAKENLVKKELEKIKINPA
ncbi:pyridoxal-dependent decarboxylase [Peptostreptococcaceae bacterium AGR-M142]